LYGVTKLHFHPHNLIMIRRITEYLLRCPWAPVCWSTVLRSTSPCAKISSASVCSASSPRDPKMSAPHQ
jgi:hypothetical protein